MSITLTGVLSIKSISGNRGAFSVGDLSTEVGNFRIKDAFLDEFEPGQYKGRFVVSSIYPYSYVWRGKVSVEIRAKLLEILLDEEAEVASGSETSVPESHGVDAEPDPIDEPAPVPAPAAVPKPAAARPARNVIPTTSAERTETPSSDTPSIFQQEIQEAVDAGGPVKLDPTVDRLVFRQQRDALKALGFRFDAAAQHWIKA